MKTTIIIAIIIIISVFILKNNEIMLLLSVLNDSFLVKQLYERYFIKHSKPTLMLEFKIYQQFFEINYLLTYILLVLLS